MKKALSLYYLNFAFHRNVAKFFLNFVESVKKSAKNRLNFE